MWQKDIFVGSCNVIWKRRIYDGYLEMRVCLKLITVILIIMARYAFLSPGTHNIKVLWCMSNLQIKLWTWNHTHPSGKWHCQKFWQKKFLIKKAFVFRMQNVSEQWEVTSSILNCVSWFRYILKRSLNFFIL